MHDHVNHAVVEQIFGTLEPFRQFLADGLFDDARAGKADQRAGFGDLHIAQHGVGRGDAAGGRIGQHHDVRQLRFPQHLHADGGARHLHQRQDAFLHPRAARGREHDERRLLLHRKLEPAHDRFPRSHAERAAHEIEILHRDDDAGAFQLAVADLDGVVQPGLGARVLDAVDIFALVAKLERIGRHFRQRDVVPGLVVEDRLQPRHRAHAHVVVRAGDDELVGLDVLVEHELPGIRALDPQILRRLAAQDVADFWTDDVGEPIHGSLRMRLDALTGLYGDPDLARQAAANVAYSAACFAPRTPCARAVTKSATAPTVPRVAWPSLSRLARSASTSAVPTTAPLAFSAIALAASGVRMPKPTQTGSLV